MEHIFESLDYEVAVLRKAVTDGIYRTRSIVGDQCLRIENEIKNLKRTVHHLSAVEADADIEMIGEDMAFDLGDIGNK